MDDTYLQTVSADCGAVLVRYTFSDGMTRGYAVEWYDADDCLQRRYFATLFDASDFYDTVTKESRHKAVEAAQLNGGIYY